MKIAANLTTHRHNREVQLANLERLAVEVAAAIKALKQSLAQPDPPTAAQQRAAAREQKRLEREQFLAGVKERVAAAQARIRAAAPKYPPWATTAELQAQYRRQLKLRAAAAARAEGRRRAREARQTEGGGSA